EVGDPEIITAGAFRLSSNARVRWIARQADNVFAHSVFFCDGLSLHTGSGGDSMAVTRFLDEKLRRHNITASFVLGGITGNMVD
ncbi:citrate lyase subunit alpha, partial [Salmonella enterica subsp. enterica serovar Kentucky]|uniref:citrate lyase subunit alpha n=1 Tax=Salmonella enterica TaxID=28901 RepID=UPI003F4B5755